MIDETQKIRIAAMALMRYRGFGYSEDPSEGGQDLYEMSCEAWGEAEEVIHALGRIKD